MLEGRRAQRSNITDAAIHGQILHDAGATAVVDAMHSRGTGIEARMRMTLERGSWYGMTMYPGYIGTAYHSPIRIQAVRPLVTGRRMIEIDFRNAAYAAGVQDFTYRLSILKRATEYLLAAIDDGNDRSISIVDIQPDWMTQYFPHLDTELDRLIASNSTLGGALDALTGFHG
jgi:hypothetical protein